MIDIGFSHPEGITYLSSELPDSGSAQIEAFYARVKSWSSEHGFVLGEGSMITDVSDTDGTYFVLRAPIIEGYVEIAERVI